MSTAQIQKVLIYLSIGILILLTVVLFHSAYHYFYFSPDSWGYFEISKNIFSNFQKINTLRQYQVMTDLNIFFPPLFPILVAFFHKLTYMTPRNLLWINLIFLIGFCLTLINFSIKVFGKRIYALLILGAFLVDVDYVNELLAGRSIPVTLIFYTLLFQVLLVNEKLTKVQSSLLGILCAVICLVRFDFFLSSLVLMVLHTFKSNSNRVKAGLAFFFTFFLTLSPLFVYNKIHHGKILMSDNSFTLLSSHRVFANFYFETPPPTIASEPIIWIKKSILSSWITIKTYIKHILFHAQLSLAVFFLLLVLLIKRKQLFPFIKSRNGAYLILLACFASQLLNYLLINYSTTRYLLPLKLLLIIMAIDTLKTFAHSSMRILTIALATLTLISVKDVYQYHQMNNFQVGALETQSFEKLSQRLKSCIHEKDSIAILYGAPISSFRFGAMTGMRVLSQPVNLTANNLHSWLDKFKANVVLLGSNKSLQPSQYRQIECPGLEVYARD